MTIYKLERESVAWQVINMLHGIHGDINSVVLWLRDTSRTITTIDIINTRGSWSNVYTLLNDFNNTYGSWFQTAWSDYYVALTGAIPSFVTINTIINNGLQNWYWDIETNKPIISDISQEHRNQLANLIEAEMEQ